MMKVSIITPFYNGSRYIEKCIRSIQLQFPKDFEHIIVNDGSTESENKFILNIISKYPNITLISQKNLGQASAINAGIKIAQGEYIAFCDQDDWWMPEKLKKQVTYLDTHPDISMVYSDAYLGDDDDNALQKTWMQSRSVKPQKGGYDDCVTELFKRNFVCAPLVILIRGDVFKKIGAMNPFFKSIYDYDFLFRYFIAGYNIGFIDSSLAVWRVHDGQSSKNIRTVKKEQLGILASFLFCRIGFALHHPILVVKKIIFTFGGFLFAKTVL